MKRAQIYVYVLSIALIYGSTAPTVAAVQHIGDFSAWSVYKQEIDGRTTCFTSSKPEKTSPTGVNRDPVFFLVTNFADKNEPAVVQTLIGYPFKKSSIVTLKIGSNSFKLYTENDAAWAPNAKKDSEIVASMKRGLRMNVTGTSSRGTVTTDYYSLKGFTLAVNKIHEECFKKLPGSMPVPQ